MNENLVKDENYINIQGWMVNKLKLSGNELIIYALIYGFSQIDNHTFHGSLQYICNWTNISKQSCIANLKKLVDKNLIIKTEKEINGLKFCEYSTNFNTIEETLIPIEETSTNNINNNIENINNSIINNTIMEKPKTPFSKLENNLEETKKPKKRNLTKSQKNAIQCNQILENFLQYEPPAVQNALKLYVEVRKSKGLQAEQLQIILEEFKKEYNGKPQAIVLEQIRKATAGGWTMLSYKDTFKGTPKVSYGTKPSFDNTMNHNIPKGVASMTKEEREEYEKHELARDENGNLIKF